MLTKVFCLISVHREMSINHVSDIIMGNLAGLSAITLQTMSMCPGGQQVPIQNKIIL